jgi:hypothetical protein
MRSEGLVHVAFRLGYQRQSTCANREFYNEVPLFTTASQARQRFHDTRFERLSMQKAALDNS